MTELRSWADGTQTSYGYDDRSQLTAATTTAIVGMTPPFGLPGGEGYDFDAGGNRQGSGGTPQSATGTHNQLQTDGAYNYFYDGEGNLIRRESLSNFAATLYEWDHRNRLISVKEAPFYQAGPIYQNMIARRIEYIYDAFDQRVGRRIEDTGGGSGGIWGIQWKRYEAYAWADGQEALRFTDSDGVESAEPFRLANRYLWSNQVDQLLAEEQYTGNSGPAIDALAAHPSAGETFWPLTDHLGSVRGLVDNNGVIRQHVSYDSFGNRLVEQHYDSAGAAVAASHAEAVDTLFGYTGRVWDSDTGLQYNRARWYNPSTGRWLSQDPIGFAAGDANLYRYVGNAVTAKTDPSGLRDPNLDTIEVRRYVEREGYWGSSQQMAAEAARRRSVREYYGDGCYRIESGSLDSVLQVEYFARAFVGAFQITRFGTQAVGIRMQDDRTIASESRSTRMDFLVAYAVAIGVPADGQFHKVDVPEWTNAFAYTGRFTVTGGSAGFWLSGPHTLDAAGSYEIRLNSGSIPTAGGKLRLGTVRNVNLRWRLTDRVDANSIKEFKWPGGGGWQIVAGCLETVLGDFVGDKVLGGGYDMQIFFHQNEPSQQTPSTTIR